jgi:hypothetical protein
MFHVPNLMTIFRHLGCLSKESDQVQGCLWFFIQACLYGEELLAPCPTPSWKTTPFRLSVAAYSIYLKSPFIAGRPSMRNPRTCHAVATRDPTYHRLRLITLTENCNLEKSI